MGFKDWVEAIVSIIKGLSIIIASIVAVRGLNSWRFELKGKKEIELAEQVLALFYECRDAIKMIRNPFSFSGEGQTRKRSENEIENETKLLDQAYVVFERYEKVKSSFTTLRSLKYRFIIVFGKDSEEPFIKLFQTMNEILVSSNILAGIYLSRLKNGSLDPASLEIMKDNEKIFYEMSKDDEINMKVDSAIESIENICKKTLQKK